MTDNSVNKSITMPVDEDESVQSEVNTFPLAIHELGESLFENYPEKTSNLSEENILGTIRCNAINNFMQMRYGYRYSVLDLIVEKKMQRSLSKNGYGIEKFIEIVKSVQATFQNTQDSPSLSDRMRGR